MYLCFVNFFVVLLFIQFGKAYEGSHSIAVKQTAYKGNFEFAEAHQTTLNIVTENTFSFKKNLDFKITPDLLYINTPKNTSLNTFYTDAKELSLNYYGKKSTLTAGYFQMKKEGPDIFDPFDYQQPQNYLDPQQTKNLSLLGLKSEFQIKSNLNLELAYVPMNRTPILPKENSPWYPRENKFPTQSDNYDLRLPENVNYKILENDALATNDLKNNYIAKIKYTAGQTDLIVQISETLSKTPAVTPVLTGSVVATSPITIINLDNPIGLKIKWQKSKHYGMGITQTFSEAGFIIKAFYDKEILNQQNTENLTFAVEKQFEEVICLIEHSLQKIEVAKDSRSSTLANLFENASALAIRWAPQETLSIYVGALNDWKYGSQAQFFKANKALSDNFSFEGQLVLLGGKQNSLLWYFEQNDSVSIAAKYAF